VALATVIHQEKAMALESYDLEQFIGAYMLTQERLKELLDYDEKSGVFTRKIARNKNNACVGSIAGSRHNEGYMRIAIDGKQYLSHRLAWLYVYGAWPPDAIDHVDHLRTNNRIDNLRSVKWKENNRNSSKRRTNKSGITGVYWSKIANKWHAQIRVNSKRLHLGYFTEIAKAAIVRKCAEMKYGFHENHGRP
jgi:hypothetical protein